MKIMLIDDNVDVCLIMKEILMDILNHDLKYCHEYEIFLEQHIDYEVALVDLNLGERKKSGIDVYDWLKEKDYQGKIVFFTGNTTHPAMLPLLGRKNVALLEKPASIESIEQMLTLH